LRFAEIQDNLRVAGRSRAIVALPSIDLGPRYAARTDLASFESRWLYWLLALREPGTRVAIVTSDAVPDWEVDYYLGLIPDADAPRERLLMVAMGDLDKRPLAAKLLERPDLLAELRDFGAAADCRFTIPFNAGRDDARVAEATQIPIWGVDHRFAHWGTKSGGRRLFEQAAVAVPRGFRDLRDAAAVDEAIAALGGDPAVVKLDQGVTGDGNAIVARAADLPPAIAAELHHGTVVEELIDVVASPSVQVRIHPGGRAEVVATHDQLLDGQRYVACRHPAGVRGIADAGLRVGARLAREGAVGRFALDFVVDRGGRAYAVEANLREGGTTHPHGTFELLGARPDYFATDAVVDPSFAGLDGRRLIAALDEEGLAYDQAERTGIDLFMLRALAIEGRIGLVAFGRSPAHADELQRRVREVIGELALART
jgi:hypothetical protein